MQTRRKHGRHKVQQVPSRVEAVHVQGGKSKCLAVTVQHTACSILLTTVLAPALATGCWRSFRCVLALSDTQVCFSLHPSVAAHQFEQPRSRSINADAMLSKAAQEDACMLLIHMVRECAATNLQERYALTSLIEVIMQRYHLHLTATASSNLDHHA